MRFAILAGALIALIALSPAIVNADDWEPAQNTTTAVGQWWGLRVPGCTSPTAVAKGSNTLVLATGTMNSSIKGWWVCNGEYVHPVATEQMTWTLRYGWSVPTSVALQCALCFDGSPSAEVDINQAVVVMVSGLS